MSEKDMTTYPPGGNAILVEETDTTPVIVRREDAVPIHVGITIVEDIEVVPGVTATIIEEDIDLQGLQVEEVHEGVQGDIKEEVEIEIKVGVKAEVVIIKNQRVGIDQMRVTILEIMIINPGEIVKVLKAIIIHIIKMRKISIMRNLIIKSKIKYIIYFYIY